MFSDMLPIILASLVGLCVVAASLLKGWQGWLDLQARSIESGLPETAGGSRNGMARIEIADLKERIRKLEAIAAGVDL